MTATIIMFPLRAREALSAPEVGNMLSSALPLPSPSSELERLLENAGHLLDNLDDVAELVEQSVERLDQGGDLDAFVKVADLLCWC